MINILFEDEHICICEKLPGMLSEDSQSDESLPKMLKEQLKCDIYTLHRLDKPVGGAIVYAKTKVAASAFSKLISENAITKQYITVLDAIPAEDEAELDDLLFRDRQKNKTYIVGRIRKGVKDAKLTYSVIGKAENHALTLVTLITGRTHQIRAQFASRKMPVTGDGKYGSRDNRCETALWSHKLIFTHPITGEKISVTSQPPYESYPWSLFKR
ncbi:MAG: RluA family pseudouridine synthase [Clostridia bacterium]|nr:RluA family pseudouridine synthase [Clostridia bacterium]